MAYASTDDVIRHIRALERPGLIAIDGLPVSGKSTLADHLMDRLGLETIYLDDFVLPPEEWPASRVPAFPFGYIRYAEFLATIRALAEAGKATFHPFDWKTVSRAAARRTVELKNHVLIEGVSALNPVVADRYALRIFVASDRATTLQAALHRGVGDWQDEWRNWFLPSADLYFATNPASRADLVVAGRGLVEVEQSPLE